MSDEELIKLALSAAPEAVTKDATVITVGTDGKTRTLRQGSGQWTCMPGHTDRADPDPMCGDKNAMEWAAAWMGHKDPPANKVGFMYMLRGDGGASNTDPYSMKEEPGNNWIKTGLARDDRRLWRQDVGWLSARGQGRSDKAVCDVARNDI